MRMMIPAVSSGGANNWLMVERVRFFCLANKRTARNAPMKSAMFLSPKKSMISRMPAMPAIHAAPEPSATLRIEEKLIKTIGNTTGASE